MNMPGSSNQGDEIIAHSQWSEEQKCAVQEELNRILADPAFKSSKRCQSMLTRLVEFALADDHEGIKERTLGVEVFGRDLHYDTSTDPIVRITANEIRKRLAQWYSEPSVHHPVRIRLVPGSYLPKFDFDSGASMAELVDEKLVLPCVDNPVANSPLGWRKFGWLLRTALHSKWLWGAVALLLVAVVASLIWRNQFSRRQQQIWEPLLEHQDQVTMCAATVDMLDETDENHKAAYDIVLRIIASREVPRAKSNMVLLTNMSMIDAFTANKLGNLVGQYGKKSVLRPAAELSFDSLRHQPLVLIGGYNPWSLILLSKLRYSVRVDPVTQSKWIQDAKNPGYREWSVVGTPDHAEVDYAIISRFVDQETGQWTLALGGLWPYGTGSALSLLTDAEYAHLLPDAFYKRQNAQLVMKTAVINGNPGPPQVVAVHTW